MTPTPKPTVLVLDEDPSIPLSITKLLRPAGYQVRSCGCARRVLADGRPDGLCCLILDLRLGDGQDGLGFHESLRRSGVVVPTLFMGGQGDINAAVRAFRSGAMDFLTKPFDPDRLLGAVTAAIDQDVVWRQRARTTAVLQERHASLTPREREVFATVTWGLLNKHAAHELGIAEKTIKVHRARVMAKMNAVSLADLVRMAVILDVRWEITDPGFSTCPEPLAQVAAACAGGTARS